MAKNKSKKLRKWTSDELLLMKKFVDDAVAKGNSAVDGERAAAKHFGVSLNSIRIKYGRYLKGQRLPKTMIKLPGSAFVTEKLAEIKSKINAPNAKKAGTRNWSKSDVKQFRIIMAAAPTKDKGFTAAAEQFNRSLVAVQVKWRKLGNKKSIRNSAYKLPKAPLIDAIIDDGGIGRKSLTLEIKEVKVDLENKKLTIYY